MKRTPSPEPNQAQLPILASLKTPVSPPSPSRRRWSFKPPKTNTDPTPTTPSEEEGPPNLAALEAGKIQITNGNHLSIISSRLHECTRPIHLHHPEIQIPHLPIPAWTDLYRRNENAQGHHFVIHQHDHPIAGTHYDLRLQFSVDSSVSWSVMYGLPGNPNSGRLNRNATETRVHCFWNHLIETASPKTGSMLIWDTGLYEVLPYRIDQERSLETEEESGDGEEGSRDYGGEVRSESEKLRDAFRDRKIRLRLHGTRLPKNYTILLRLDKASDIVRPATTVPRKRRRRESTRAKAVKSRRRSTSSPSPGASSPHSDEADSPANLTDSEETDHQIRLNNAYPGSTNSIGSIHQRRWFITLDRVNSGFEPDHSTRTETGKKTWTRRRDPETGELLGFELFYVRGPDTERSVVTGRLGREIMEDEGVKGFVRRRAWRAVLN